jgi:hypothetical protein
MIRHTVLIWALPDTPTTELQAVIDAVAELPSLIEEIDTYAVGFDAGLSEGSPDIAIMATYEDEDAFNTYRLHPAHVAVVKDMVEPICERRVSTQLVTP